MIRTPELVYGRKCLLLNTDGKIHLANSQYDRIQLIITNTLSSRRAKSMGFHPKVKLLVVKYQAFNYRLLSTTNGRRDV